MKRFIKTIPKNNDAEIKIAITTLVIKPFIANVQKSRVENGSNMLKFSLYTISPTPTQNQ